MEAKDVKIGVIYMVKVSGSLAPVRLTGESPYGGWDGQNEITHRDVRVKTAARLRRAIQRCTRCGAWDFEVYILAGVCALCQRIPQGAPA